LALRESYGEGNILWASYLLYGDPAVRYFSKDDIEKEEEEEEGLLATAGVGSTQSQKTQEAYIQKNGLRTRSASKTDNGIYGWRSKTGLKKDSTQFKKGLHKKLFISIAGIVLGIFLLFGVFHNKIRIKLFRSNNIIQMPEASTEKLNQLKELVKAGMASDDQMVEFFQGLVKKYHSEVSQPVDERDLWTSRPIALFFIPGNSDDSRNPKTDISEERLMHKLMAILGQDKEITILEREYLVTLLKELEIGSSPLADPGHNLRLGQIVAGNLFTICSIGYFEGTWQINLRIIASETSKVEAAITETWTDLENLDKVAKGLVNKLLTSIEQAFPLKGRIKHYFNDQKVMINIGYRQGVEQGMQFDTLKEIDILDDQGRSIAKDAISIASLRINEVREDFSYAVVLERTENLIPGMKVSVLDNQDVTIQ
jgi:hypothetical protein